MIVFDEAFKLSAEFGGMDHFDIPHDIGVLRLALNREIVYKFLKGKNAPSTSTGICSDGACSSKDTF